MIRNKFIAVFHSWHVNSRKWEIKELDASTKEEAKEKADAILGRKAGDFYNWDYKLIDNTCDEYTLMAPLNEYKDGYIMELNYCEVVDLLAQYRDTANDSVKELKITKVRDFFEKAVPKTRY